MRYSASDKTEIIRLAEQSPLPARRTLDKLGAPRSSFYRWYDRNQRGGLEALADRPSRPDRSGTVSQRLSAATMMFKDRRDAGRKLHPGAGTLQDGQSRLVGRGTFEPTSFRRMRSASLMTPITRPASSTTGSALISLSTSGFATSDIEACGWVVITCRTMTSEAFIRRFSLTIENLYKPKSLPTPGLTTSR